MKRISEAFKMGYGRALDLTGTKRWPDITNNKTKDCEALRGDWENVGRTIQRETRNYARMCGRK